MRIADCGLRNVADVGERAVVRMLARIFEGGRMKDDGGRRNVEAGIGDDCALLRAGSARIAATTDIVTGRGHIPPGAPPGLIGWHAMAVSLSDLAAKGARPLAFLASFALPRTTKVAFLKGVARGMAVCGRRFGVPVAGGDTKEAGEFSISGTALGTVRPGRFIGRGGARAGDVVAVTGPLGGPAAAYRSLSAKAEGGRRKAEYRALLRIVPRVAEGMALARTGAVTASTDLSDGLAAGLHIISEASGAGLRVDREDLPVAPAARRAARDGSDLEDLALQFGGEYELLVTVKREGCPRAERAVRAAGGRLHRIGTVVGRHGVFLTGGGTEKILTRFGWEHFRGK